MTQAEISLIRKHLLDALRLVTPSRAIPTLTPNEFVKQSSRVIPLIDQLIAEDQ